MNNKPATSRANYSALLLPALHLYIQNGDKLKEKPNTFVDKHKEYINIYTYLPMQDTSSHLMVFDVYKNESHAMIFTVN